MNKNRNTKDQRRFNRLFDRLETSVPGFLGRTVRFLRHPWAMLIRIPLGLMLVAGGIFSFLPILGLWMLPLGFLLLAIDFHYLQRPVSIVIIRVQRWWETRRFGRK